MEYDQVKELDLIAAYEDKNVEALYGTALKLQATALLLLRHQQEGAVPAVPPRVGTDSTESSRGSWEGCSQQWVQAEHEYPTDYESSTLCWGSKSGVEVWVYDAEKKTSSIRALSDLEGKVGTLLF
jgi:hypothetical protein